ncbi:Cytoplasmic polyadenylation element-binding protein 2 [Orchesella cincta]|uniref:Cytoplasmic polyadenylation element-binding protein 2 n=1 Tax=Orchesella cincta TaxID=48709 RepID=A0A1D2MT45_ORCCI|nr:Cytoplasmic polyadenylation element-binding protein 2 [Orchesella cincta]
MKSGLLQQYGLSSAHVFDSVHLGALNSSGHVNFYSRKVFLGGLPPDIDEHEIKAVFWKFGSFEVYWPGKDDNPNYMFPPKGFAFLLFLAEDSVRRLVQACIHGNDGGLYYLLSSPSVKNKVIQVKPWKLSDAVTIVHESLFTKKQFAVFVGGVPRALTSGELARQALCVFGNVSYSEIFLDYKIGYPKGSGVIYFSNFKSFVSAIRTKFFEVVVGDSVKYVSRTKAVFQKMVVTGENPISSLYPEL